MLQWIIYDSYAEDFEQSEREKEKERKVWFGLLCGLWILKKQMVNIKIV